jgi:hypothetical protein
MHVPLLGNVLDRRLATTPANEAGEPLGVERIVGQKVEPLAFHFATLPAKNTSHFDFEKYARARECEGIRNHRTALAKRNDAGFGVAKDAAHRRCGRKLGNAYACRNRRFRFAEAAIEIPAPFRVPPNARNPAMMRLSVTLTPAIHPHYFDDDPVFKIKVDRHQLGSRIAPCRTTITYPPARNN